MPAQVLGLDKHKNASLMFSAVYPLIRSLLEKRLIICIFPSFSYKMLQSDPTIARHKRILTSIILLAGEIAK